MSAPFNHTHYHFIKVFTQLNLKRISKIAICVIIMIILCYIPESYCYKCPTSSSITAAITSEQCSFSGYANTATYKVASGQVSNSLYYMYFILAPSVCAIRKVNSDGTFAWMAAVSFQPIIKSLSIDSLEKFVYIASITNPLIVGRFLSSTGEIVDFQTHSFLGGNSNGIKIHPLSDSSGYYVIGSNSNLANICKYLFSTSASSQCQQIPNLGYFGYAYGQLKLSDNSFFMNGYHPSSPYPLHMYKLTFGQTSPDWNLSMLCSIGTCSLGLSESLLISSSIYTFFPYGSIKYLYMAVISLSDGSVSNRYKSSIACDYLSGSGVNGDYIVASIYCSSPYLLMFNRATNAFTIKSFSGTYLYGVALETTTNRFVINGQKSNNGYTTKFAIRYLSYHPDFQTVTSWSMNILTFGTEDFVKSNGQIIGAITLQVVNQPSPAYTNITVTYVPVTSYTFDAYFQENDQIISVPESITSQTDLTLSCSISGSTSITYSINNYITSTAPSWVSIDSVSGKLTIIAPEVTSNTEYDFYVYSSISGLVNLIQKEIKLTILNCVPSNCKKCVKTSSTTCEVCNSGYYLVSGACQTSSETAQAISKTTISTAISIAGIIALASLINATSLATLWMTINHLQLFFLLLLTRAYIPIDIQTVIKGLDFVSNVYGYFPLNKLSFYPAFLRNFEFELTNKLLVPLNIKYDSTFANIISFLACTFLMILFCLFVYFIKIFASKFRESRRCSCVAKFQYRIVEKLYKIMTFGYFIRNALEMSQFILITSINEVNECNTSYSYRLISFAFSILMILIFILMIILVLYLTFSSHRLNESEHNKFEEFFRGLQQNKKHKLYVTLLLFRRLGFITFLITCIFIPSRILIITLALFQLIYIAILTYLRPYEATKGNIIEILNETYFGLLILLLAIINTEDEWNSVKTITYMWILASNTFVVFIIVFGYTIKELVSFFKRKYCRIKENKNESIRVMPK